MAVTGHVTDADLRLWQVNRMVKSHTLHGSESLCKLLRYLAEHVIKHPGAGLKEYQIATEVFGRTVDFDPHLDSLVRVQAGRLRSKVAEYYSTEGAGDPIIVELPKGSYTLAFHPGPPDKRTAPLASEATRYDQRKLPWLVIALSGSLVLAVVIIAVLVSNGAVHGRTTTDEAPPAVFKIFWQKFTSGPEEPWVIFSNGAFVGRPETGLRYFEPARDSQAAILDHYTGVGEVLAVNDLDHVLGRLHQPIRVKRGSLFSLDDAQNNNLIFVGSPAENLTLRDIPSTHEFVFQRPASGPRRGDLAVVNVHPLPGESKIFFASQSGTPLTEDYAILGLIPGLNPARWVLILAGTTTIGTQAAAEYVSRQDSLEQLLLRLSISENGDMKPFEAVLHVHVTRGVPVGSELVAIRKVLQ